MRIAFTIIFACLITALLVCAHKARHSGKDLGIPVMYMLLALIPPIVGNLIIIASTDKTVSTIGYYIYFLGMDLVVMVLLQFSMIYCDIKCNEKISALITLIIGLDVLQILSNPFIGQTFAVEEIVAYGAPYYRLIPLLGQTFHRVVDYAIIAAVVVMFIVKIRRSPRVYTERYAVILGVMVVTIIWETLYILSRTPMDRSMIGFGVFGLLVFYFSLYHKPFLLLDRMLAAMASDVPEALYCFDINGKCIWVNKRGIELANVTGNSFDTAALKLETMLGDLQNIEDDKPEQRTAGSGETAKSYVLERRSVKDDKGRYVGAFLSVRDNTREQKTLQHEIYNATHDSLTHLYNRAGYDLLVQNLDMSNATMLLLDVDEFKSVNDEYGHQVGDRVLQKVARTMVRYFRTEDYVCRIGGDEFIVLMFRVAESEYGKIHDRIEAINDTLMDGSDGLPQVTVSVGLAYGNKGIDPEELFAHADRALYNTKHEERNGITRYSDSLTEDDTIWESNEPNTETYN